MTLFWYDLETSGVSPRGDRVMQFAGQRTTIDLQPVGEPVNMLIRLSDDILPAPDAVLLTGITPQQTVADGVTEAEFLQQFRDEVATPGTVFVGFNSIRFDDEFMRFLHYRNFYDPYTWQWQDGRSRWDLLDVTRMTRALRPDGIKWPVVDGKPGNRLELLTKANGIAHDDAHDALGDVRASIALADLIRTKQPKLFQWLFEHRDKSSVAELVDAGEPIVYSSGKYDAAMEKTTVVSKLASHPNKQGALVYDLRHDPTPFLQMSPKELAERWQWTRDVDAPARLPIKTMQYNRCPAVAPISVLDETSRKRIALDMQQITAHLKVLRKNHDFTERVMEALKLLDIQQEKRQAAGNHDADVSLYDGFLDTHDANLLGVVRAAEPEELGDELASTFHDRRMRELLPRYKARNFPSSMTDEERAAWESHRHHSLIDGGTKSRLAVYMHRLAALADTVTDSDKRYLLEELQLYAESIMPVLDAD